MSPVPLQVLAINTIGLSYMLRRILRNADTISAPHTRKYSPYRQNTSRYTPLVLDEGGEIRALALGDPSAVSPCLH